MTPLETFYRSVSLLGAEGFLHGFPALSFPGFLSLFVCPIIILWRDSFLLLARGTRVKVIFHF